MPKSSKTEKVTSEVKLAEVEVKATAPVAENKKAKKVTQKVEAVEQASPVKVEVVEAPVKITKVVSKKVAAPVVQKEEVATEQPEQPQQEGGKKRVRYFRCVYSDDTFGRFSGYKPKQAAGKALTSILRHRDAEGKDLSEEISFSMIECTRGGNHKVSQYNGKRVKLEKPVTVTIKTSDGKKKEINYNFTNKITKLKADKKAAPKTEKKAPKKVAKKSVKKAVAKKPEAKKASVAKTTAKKAVVAKTTAKKTTKKTEA